MRVAICISGLTRTYKTAYSSFINNLLKPNSTIHDMDVFISSWFNSDSTISQESDRGRPIDVVPISIFDIFNHYNPKRIVLENDVPLNVDYVHYQRPQTNVKSVARMWYKINHCDRLRREYELELGFKYDLVVRTRFDALYPKPIVFSELDRSVLHIPAMATAECDYCKQLWCNDKFAIGTGLLMANYCRLYDSLRRLQAIGVIFQPEVLLYYHLAESGIRWQSLGYDIELCRAAVAN